MSDEKEEIAQKIGAGHVQAMIRAGAKELAQALVALPDGNIRPVEEPGLVGNLTPQEIVHGKTQYESVLKGYAQSEPTAQQNDRGVER